MICPSMMGMLQQRRRDIEEKYARARDARAAIEMALNADTVPAEEVEVP